MCLSCDQQLINEFTRDIKYIDSYSQYFIDQDTVSYSFDFGAEEEDLIDTKLCVGCIISQLFGYASNYEHNIRVQYDELRGQDINLEFDIAKLPTFHVSIYDYGTRSGLSIRCGLIIFAFLSKNPNDLTNIYSLLKTKYGSKFGNTNFSDLQEHYNDFQEIRRLSR